MAWLPLKGSVARSSLGKAIKLLNTVSRHRGLLHALHILFTTGIEKLASARYYEASPREKELYYWEKQFAGVGDFSACMTLRANKSTQRQLFPVELLPFFERVQGEVKPGSRPRVLDVGAGPISTLSWGHHVGLFELATADPLAGEYKKLLCSYGYEPAMGSIQMIESTGEALDLKVEPGSFDVVFCRNALDHTESPRLCLEQMVKAVGARGYIIVMGRSHEGSHEGWDEIHQHDLFVLEDTLWRSGKDGIVALLTEGLPLVTDYVAVEPGFHGWMVIIFKNLDC